MTPWTFRSVMQLTRNQTIIPVSQLKQLKLSKHMWKLKNNERAQKRGRITRNINRVRKFTDQGAGMRKRAEKEMIEIREDFELARQ